LDFYGNIINKFRNKYCREGINQILLAVNNCNIMKEKVLKVTENIKETNKQIWFFPR